MTHYSDLDHACANAIRTLTLDAVQTANSGHPGMPLGMADVAYVLHAKFLRLDPHAPKWFNRDRFVVSAGHGSMLLYALLYLTGAAGMPLDELKRFRQLHSRTPGHPENHMTEGVETTTGPLGSGTANSVGMALAEAWLAAKLNRPGHTVVDHRTYAIVSDGDLQEGVSHEAASLAGHLGLGKLVWLYDDNNISIDGPTSLSYSDHVPMRFKAYGWHTISIDAHDMGAVEQAIREAHFIADRPTLISCKSVIGKGLPKQGTSKAHSDAQGWDDVKAAKRSYGADPDKTFSFQTMFWRVGAISPHRALRRMLHGIAQFQRCKPPIPTRLRFCVRLFLANGRPIGLRRCLSSTRPTSRWPRARLAAR